MAAENTPRPPWMAVCFKWSFFVLMFLTMVVPNSIKPVSVSFLALTALIGWRLTDFTPAFMRVVWMHVASSVVTLVFLLVGLLNGASNEALIQTLFIYIVSPAMWILVAGGVLAVMDADDLQGLMENNAILACASVALFFYLFLNFGPEGVSFFIEPENANVNLQEGYAGATMHVYGTLIFLSSAMFAMLTAGRMDTKLLITLGMLVVAAVTSGRSALLLSLPIGLAAGAALRPGIYGQVAGTLAWNLGKQIGIAVAAAVIFVILLTAFTEVDVLYIITGFWEELSGGGGSERTNQAGALFEGIITTFGIGAGHGVGVNYIRSELFPWRYEIVLLATIYRVGFVGAFIYAWPFIRYGWGVFEVWKRHRLTNFDVFLFTGCASAFIAAATNPYIEGYTFHWMYVLPLTIFLVRHPGTSIFDARPRRSGQARVQAGDPRAVAAYARQQAQQAGRGPQMARGQQPARGQQQVRGQQQMAYAQQMMCGQPGMRPPQGYPQQPGMRPQQGRVPPGYPQQGMRPLHAGHPQQGRVPPGYPQQQGARPQQGRAPQGYPQQPGMRPQQAGHPQQPGVRPRQAGQPQQRGYPPAGGTRRDGR